MDVELFVHGVPYGADFWGKEEDSDYFGLFYDKCADEVKFLVQVRSSRGKAYCYYNYLVYKTAGAPTPNIVANDGRAGSYFGMTLRLDAYCKDYDNMYRILDTLYNIYIVGDLLKADKSTLKYAISDFSKASDTLDRVEGEALQLIGNGFRDDDFVSLAGFAAGGIVSSFAKANLYDYTQADIFAEVKKRGGVILSPYYPSKREMAMQKQCEEQIIQTKKLCDEKVRTNADALRREKEEISTSYSTAKGKLQQQEQSIAQKDATISQLKTDVEKLKNDIKKAGQTKEIGQLVAQIKEPTTKLTELLSTVAPARETRPKGADAHKWFSLLPFINLLLLVIAICLLLASRCSMSFTQPDEAMSDWSDASYKDMAQISEEESYSATKADSPADDKDIAVENVDTNADTPFAMQEFDIEDVFLDIKDYGGGPIHINKEYTVSAKKGKDACSWQIEGGVIIVTSNPQVAKFIPNKETVILKYTVNGKTKERTLQAEL